MKRYLEFYLNVGQHIQTSYKGPNKLGLTRCGCSDNPKYKEDVMLYTRLRLLEKLANIELGECSKSKKVTPIELFFQCAFLNIYQVYTFDTCSENCVGLFVWFLGLIQFEGCVEG